MLTPQRFVAGPLGLVVGLDSVIFLARHGVLGQQLFVSGQVGGGVIHQHVRFDHGGIGDCGIGSGGSDGTGGDVAPCQRGLVFGAGAVKGQTQVGVVDDDKRVALSHRLVLTETDLLDVALHAAVDGRDLLVHLRVVGELHVVQMHELDTHPCQGGTDDYQCQYVGEYLLGSFLAHDFS